MDTDNTTRSSTTLLRRAFAAIREKPIIGLVVVLAIAGGPLLAGMIFPEAPFAKQLIGGWLLGAWGAFCAIPEQFL